MTTPERRAARKKVILARLAEGTIRGIYPDGTRKMIGDDVDGVPCGCCAERVFKHTQAVEYTLPDDSRHVFHLYCDALRLVVAAEHLNRLARGQKAILDALDEP